MIKQYGVRIESEIIDLAKEIAEYEDRSINSVLKKWLIKSIVCDFLVKKGTHASIMNEWTKKIKDKKFEKSFLKLFEELQDNDLQGYE